MTRPHLAAFPKGYFDELCRGERSLYSWIDEAAELPIDGIEMYPDFYPNADDETIHDVYAYAAAKGLAIPMLCTSPDFTHPDPTFRQQQIRWMQEWIVRMADSPSPSGFRSCRVLSGQNRPLVGTDEGVRWVIQAIEQLLPVAAQYRVHLVIENHYKDGQWEYPEFAQSLERFSAIVDPIHSPWFGVNYDPSNALVAGQDPIEVLGRFQSRVLTMHASDRHLKPGFDLHEITAFRGRGYPEALEHGVIGQGLIDYPAVMKILHDRQFSGWISIEDGVHGPDDLKQSAQFLQKLLDEVFGRAQEPRR